MSNPLSAVSNMLSSRPSTSSAPLSLDIPKFKKHQGNKEHNLYEITFLDEKEKIESSNLPLLNPYSAFNKRDTPNLVVKSLRAIFHKPSLVPKEYVMASAMDKCPVFATHEEQFISLDIPHNFPQQWLQEGYSHIHFGAIRFALSFHGRKSLPVVVKMALLDSRYLEYQHACLATVETTLDSGTVCATVYPNFNMSLRDPNLLSVFKIQVHIVGAMPAKADGIEATLHYQMAYRIQDHAFDIQIPGGADALIIKADENKSVTCTHVPRKCTREELLKVIPDTWVTNYEKLHERRQPIESHDTTMKRRSDGTVGISFDHSHIRKTDFLPSINLVSLLGEARYEEICQKPHWKELIQFDSDDEDRINGQSLGYGRNTGNLSWEIISHWRPDGKPVYFLKDPFTNHCFFDLCDNDCTVCEPDLSTSP